MAEIVSDTNAVAAVAIAAIGLCTLLIKVLQTNTSNDREDRKLEQEVRKAEAVAQVRIQEALNAHTMAIRELLEVTKKLGT